MADVEKPFSRTVDGFYANPKMDIHRSVAHLTPLVRFYALNFAI